MLVDAKNLFRALQFHNAIGGPKDRKADLIGRLTLLLDDAGESEVTRKGLRRFIQKETLRAQRSERLG